MTVPLLFNLLVIHRRLIHSAQQPLFHLLPKVNALAPSRLTVVVAPAVTICRNRCVLVRWSYWRYCNLNDHSVLDVNECQQQNGGCSHGCVNTPGDFYCACPHGMMRDPADPKTCINVAGSFDRITELLARYLHANSKNLDTVSSSDEKGGRRYKVLFYF